MPSSAGSNGYGTQASMPVRVAVPKPELCATGSGQDPAARLE